MNASTFAQQFSEKFRWLAIGAIVTTLIAYKFISDWQETGRLVAKLEQGSLDTQIQATYELVEWGSSSSSVLDALGNAVLSPDESLRAAASAALIQLDRHAAVDYFVAAFEERDRAIRMDARESLERIGTKRAQQIVMESESEARRSYRRASYGGWADKMRRELEQQEKQRYRKHMKVYGRNRR